MAKCEEVTKKKSVHDREHKLFHFCEIRMNLNVMHFSGKYVSCLLHVFYPDCNLCHPATNKMFINKM